MRRLIGIAIFVLVAGIAATAVFAAGPWSRGPVSRGYHSARACPYAGMSRQQRFKAFDADQNGYLSPSEFRGPSWAFSRVDGDRDGFVSAQEWAGCPAEWLCCHWGCGPRHQGARPARGCGGGCCR
jgi:hypothetical protein